MDMDIYMKKMMKIQIVMKMKWIQEIEWQLN